MKNFISKFCNNYGCTKQTYRTIHKKKEIERTGNNETKSNMKQFNTNN